MQVDTTLMLNGPNPALIANDAKLQFNQGDVQIYVQCTNTLCLIPVDDIAQSVANNFVVRD
jgi:hypothetical protein